MSRTTLTLGPLLYNWPAADWRDFYARIADEAPVDTVCIGEVACSKRQPFYADVIPETIERLERAGKTVILSTLALPTLDRELKYCGSLAREASQMIEVNDISTIPALAKRPHAIGPLINVYNEAAAAFLIAGGAARIALPPELPLKSISAIVAAARNAVIEVWAFGRIPLAISARCYHARLHGRTKDSCQFVCEQDLDGLDVETLDGERFLAVNGVQTLSYSYCNLIFEARQLESLGVSALRLSPHTCDMVAVSQIFRDVLDGIREPSHAMRAMRTICSDAAFSNGFVHGTNGALYVLE